MNTLSFRCTSENGLSFELLVDEQPLGVLIGSEHIAIPYWILDDGLPRPYSMNRTDVRIVGVCSCGEHGCGRAQCLVACEADTIIFRNFQIDASDAANAVSLTERNIEFRFARANFDAVITEIARLASEQ